MSFQGFAQTENDDALSLINQPARIEYKTRGNIENYYTINGNDEGLLVVLENGFISGRAKEWTIEALDTTLTRIWKKTFVTPDNYFYSGYEYSKSQYMILFEPGSYSNNKFITWSFDIDSGDTTSYTIDTVFPIELSEFETVGNSIILAGNSSNRTVVLVYDMKKNKTKIQPGYYESSIEILKIVPIDADSNYLIIQRKDLAEKKRVITYQLIDQYGNMLRDYTLPLDQQKSYTFGFPSDISLNNGHLVGMFTRGKSLNDQGFYISNLENSSAPIQHFDFADLDNFFGYLSPKMEEKIKQKSELKENKGKKLRRSFKVNFSDLIHTDTSFCFIAEIYKTQYASNYTINPYEFYNSQRFFYNNAQTTNNTIKTGYEYTHAVLINFDQSGKIIWDKTVKFDELETNNLRKNLFSVVNKDGSFSSLYLNKGSIILHVTNPDTTIIQTASIRLKDKYSKIRFRDDENKLVISKWYGRNLYLMGKQRIVRTKNKSKRIENVFFINKISLREHNLAKQNN